MQQTKIQKWEQCRAAENPSQINERRKQPQMNDADAEEREGEKRRNECCIVEIGGGAEGNSGGNHRNGKHYLREALKVHEGCAQRLSRSQQRTAGERRRAGFSSTRGRVAVRKEAKHCVECGIRVSGGDRFLTARSGLANHRKIRRNSEVARTPVAELGHH